MTNSLTIHIDPAAIAEAVERMLRASSSSLMRNPLSEVLSESLAAVGGEFRMMVGDVVRDVLMSPESAAAVRSAVVGAMHEEAQKIGRRLARQLAMQEVPK